MASSSQEALDRCLSGQSARRRKASLVILTPIKQGSADTLAKSPGAVDWFRLLPPRATSVVLLALPGVASSWPWSIPHPTTSTGFLVSHVLGRYPSWYYSVLWHTSGASS